MPLARLVTTLYIYKLYINLSSLSMFLAPLVIQRSPSVTFSTPRERFTITWDEPQLNIGEAVDAYFVNISGPVDLCGNGNTLQMVTEPSFTCSIQTTPQEGNLYTIRVAADSCNGNLQGLYSSPASLQGMSIIYVFVILRHQV